MPVTCQDVANIASGCVREQASQEWRQLSGMMCWNAVSHTARLSGLISEPQYRSLLSNNHRKLACIDDPIVSNSAQMLAVPPGHAICFFEFKGEKWVMIHAMISTGGGKAAGNKNDCVGVGNVAGWEELDLCHGLKWSDGFIHAPLGKHPKTGQMMYRNVYVHHNPITNLKNKL